jgi:hypothetical protein
MWQTQKVSSSVPLVADSQQQPHVVCLLYLLENVRVLNRVLLSYKSSTFPSQQMPSRRETIAIHPTPGCGPCSGGQRFDASLKQAAKGSRIQSLSIERTAACTLSLTSFKQSPVDFLGPSAEGICTPISKAGLNLKDCLFSPTSHWRVDVSR